MDEHRADGHPAGLRPRLSRLPRWLAPSPPACRRGRCRPPRRGRRRDRGDRPVRNARQVDRGRHRQRVSDLDRDGDAQSLSSQTQCARDARLRRELRRRDPRRARAPTTLTSDRSTVAPDEAKVADDEAAPRSAEALAKPSRRVDPARRGNDRDRATRRRLARRQGQLAADRRLGCPASSSATVTTRAAGRARRAAVARQAPGSSTSARARARPGHGLGHRHGPSGPRVRRTRRYVSARAVGRHRRPARRAHVAPTTTTTIPATAPVASTGTVDQTTSSVDDGDRRGRPGRSRTRRTTRVRHERQLRQTTSSTDDEQRVVHAEDRVTVVLAGLTPGDDLPLPPRRDELARHLLSAGRDLHDERAAGCDDGAATTVTATSETLAGTVDPGGSDTTYYFEWGRRASSATRRRSTDAGAGGAAHRSTRRSPGLKAGTTYDFRLVATSALGTSTRHDETFQTAASSCVAETAVVTEDAEALRDREGRPRRRRARRRLERHERRAEPR